MRRLWALPVRLLFLLAVALLVFDAFLLGMRYQVFGIFALIGLTWRITRRRWKVPSGSYGTARVAGLPDLLAGGLLSQSGLILGRVGNYARPTRGQAVRALLSPRVPSEWAVRQALAALGSRRAGGEFIRIRDFVHLATFAPAGGGKSVAVLYPNLLSYPGNCVVIDPKGELYQQTAEHRRQEFGHTIVRLDPAGLCGPGADTFNTFDWIDPNRPDFVEQCRDQANQLVIRSGKEQDPHWCDSAEAVIAALIACVCALEGNAEARTMRGMRTLLASRDRYAKALALMQQTEGFHGVLQQLSHSLSWHVDKELGSVMSHAQRFTNIFDAPLVAASTGATSFDPLALRTGKMTLYMITPADKTATWAGLQRLWLGTLLRVITRGVPNERNPVLFLVDECAHIGRMAALEDAVTLMRGMGIRLWLFFQSIEQLKKCFGENAGTVLDNLATQQYFSINSLETAEAMSRRIGEETVVIRTEGDNRGSSAPVGGDGKSPGSRNSGTTTSYSEAARRVIKPEEILTLPEDAAIIFHKNHYAIVCRKIRYYADRAFRRRGLLVRRWGTGRTRGFAVAGLMAGLALLALALLVTGVVADLVAPPAGQTTVDSSGYNAVPAFDPAPPP